MGNQPNAVQSRFRIPPLVVELCSKAAAGRGNHVFLEIHYRMRCARRTPSNTIAEICACEARKEFASFVEMFMVMETGPRPVLVAIRPAVGGTKSSGPRSPTM